MHDGFMWQQGVVGTDTGETSDIVSADIEDRKKQAVREYMVRACVMCMHVYSTVYMALHVSSNTSRGELSEINA